MSNIIKDSAYYGASNIILALAGVIVIPIYTHALSVENFGLYEIISRIAAIAMIFAVMGTLNGYARCFFEHKNSSWKNTSTFTSLIFLLAVTTLISSGVWIFRADIFSLFINENTENLDEYVKLICIWMPLDVLYAFGLIYLQIHKRAKFYCMSAIGKTATFLSLTVYFVTFLNMGIKGILLANIVASALFVAPFVTFITYTTKMAFSRPFLQNLLSYSAPLLPATILIYIANNADRYFITNYDSLAALGIYVLAAKISLMSIMILHQAFSKVWVPFLFETHDKKNGSKKIQNTLQIYIQVIILFAFIISLGGPVIISLVAAEEYFEASWVIPILCLASSVQVIAYLNDYGILIEKKTKYKIVGTAVSAILAVIGNFFLTPIFGMYGAATAYMISMLGLLVVNQYYSNRFYPLDIEWFRLLCNVTVAILISLVATQINIRYQNIYSYFIVAFFAVFTYLITIWFSHCINNQHKYFIINFFRKSLPLRK